MFHCQLFSGYPENPDMEKYFLIDLDISTANPSIDIQKILQKFTGKTDLTEEKIQKSEKKWCFGP